MVYVNLYVVHDPALTVRLENVEKVISFVFDGRTIQKSICNRYTPEHIALSSCLEEGVDPQSIRQLNLRGISNSFNHLDAITAIARNGCHDANLILEDDCVVGHWSKDDMESVLQDVPRDYDIILLGGNKSPMSRVKSFVKFQHCDSKKFDVVAYLVRRRAAEAIVSAYLPVTTNHDIQLSDVCKKLGLRVYQVERSIFFDGSKTGAFIGTIHPEDYMLSQNEVYTSIESVMNNKYVPIKTIERAKDYIATNEHNHPHLRYLFANFMKMLNNPEAALLHYAYCMDTYEEAFQNVWKLQRFLMDYIHCCKLDSLKKYSAFKDLPTSSAL
jgi:hypothetical protein